MKLLAQDVAATADIRYQQSHSAAVGRGVTYEAEASGTGMNTGNDHVRDRQTGKRPGLMRAGNESTKPTEIASTGAAMDNTNSNKGNEATSAGPASSAVCKAVGRRTLATKPHRTPR